MLTPDALLAFADRMAKESDEVGRRMAIGRAYYAVAHEALALAIRAGVPQNQQPNLHRAARQLAAMPGPHRWAKIALDIERLKQARELADYAIEYPNDFAGDAVGYVLLANDLLTRMRSTPLPTPRG